MLSVINKSALVVRWLVPMIAVFAVWVGERLIRTIAHFFAALWGSIQRVSDDHREWMAARQFPSELDRPFYYCAMAVSVLEILAGWVALAHITVWLFWLIF